MIYAINKDLPLCILCLSFSCFQLLIQMINHICPKYKIEFNSLVGSIWASASEPKNKVRLTVKNRFCLNAVSLNDFSQITVVF